MWETVLFQVSTCLFLLDSLGIGFSDLCGPLLLSRYCVMKLTERLKKEGIDINLRDALGVDTDPKLRNLRGKL